MTRVQVTAGFVLLALLGGLAFTQEASKDKPPAERTGSATASASTHKVEKKPFKIEINADGILSAEETAEISYQPQPMVQPPPSQGPLTIRTIVAHGARVKKGDALVAFDSRKVDEVIAELETETKVLTANLKLAEDELPLIQKSAPVELASVESAKKRADENLKYFVEVGRPEAENMAHFMVKVAKFYHESAQEELRQLQKMYKANDLTEDTEKIILRRQEQYVEMAAFMLQSALIDRDHTLKFDLPHKLKDLQENQVKQALHLEKTRATLEPGLVQKQQNLVKLRFELDKARHRLDRLHADRAALTIHSPQEGVVYHGKFHKGHWSNADTLAPKLVPGGSITPEEVFLTIVKPRPLVVRLSIAEKDVHWLKPGLTGKAKLPFIPDRKLPARLTQVAPLPASPGKFDAQVVLDGAADDAHLLPGMACSVIFVPYSKREAIAIPSGSIHEDDDRFVVYVVTGKNKHERRTVTPGHTDGEHTEIVAGLREGEEILVEHPHAKTPDKGSSSASPSEKGESQ
jgi:multidrug efflux pump subunit AcrA (membrane-fusion protein)